MTRTAPFLRFETAPRDFRSWVYALALGLALVMPILQRVQRALPAKAAAESGYRVSDNYKTDAYGKNLMLVGSTENTFLWMGENYDADLEMHFLRARLLNSSNGRFLTLDTFEGSREDTPTLHKYVYARNSALNFEDPSGFADKSIASQLTAVGVVTSLATAINVGNFLYSMNSGGLFTSMPTGVYISLRPIGYGGAGFFGLVGVDIVSDANSTNIATVGEFGLDPTTLYKVHRGKTEWSFAVGPTFGADPKNLLHGLGYNSVLPLAALPLLRKFVSGAATATGLLRRISQLNNKGGSGALSILYGNSSGASYAAVGPRASALSSSISWSGSLGTSLPYGLSDLISPLLSRVNSMAAEFKTGSVSDSTITGLANSVDGLRRLP